MEDIGNYGYTLFRTIPAKDGTEDAQNGDF